MEYRDLMILHELQEIKRRQSWWLDFGANVAGNAFTDALWWVGRKLISKL